MLGTLLDEDKSVRRAAANVPYLSSRSLQLYAASKSLEISGRGSRKKLPPISEVRITLSSKSLFSLLGSFANNLKISISIFRNRCKNRYSLPFYSDSKTRVNRSEKLLLKLLEMACLLFLVLSSMLNIDNIWLLRWSKHSVWNSTSSWHCNV